MSNDDSAMQIVGDEPIHTRALGRDRQQGGEGEPQPRLAIGSAVERSYSRSTFLDKCWALLDAWSESLAGDVAVIAEGGLGLRSATPR